MELIDQATAECAGQQRPDLHNRLRQIRTRILDPAQLVLVVGESKQGKSELVNAIVNAPVCNSGDDATTVIPAIVRYADEPSAQLIENGPAHGPAAIDRVPVPIEQVREQTDQAIAKGRPVTRSEIRIPRAVLKDGLVLMDTPGVGTTSSSLTATTLAAIAEADALLMVSDATQELTTTELNFLRQVTALCPNVVLVQPKIDLTTHWRRIIEVNTKHMANAGIGGKIFPISSTLRLRAAAAKDPELNKESGFPPLLDYLRNEMAAKNAQLGRRLVAHNIADAIDQITTSLRTELSSQNPRTATETLVELESAQRRAEDLKRVSARWQKTLNDGISELYSDMEFDFRERSWAIIHEANETLDKIDPNMTWDDFADWLYNNLSDSIADTFEWLNVRHQRLTELVSDQFEAELGETRPQIDKMAPPDLQERVPEPKKPQGAHYRRADQILTGLRGSYGGVLMFGLITNYIGFGLLNVVTISAGLLLGTKSLSEEKDNRLKRRQGEARVTMQRYVEQVTFQVQKETRDAIRKMHRDLHAHFAGITDESQTQITNTIHDLRRSAERSAVDRDARAREIRKKLEDLAVLRKRVQMLTTNRIAAA